MEQGETPRMYRGNSCAGRGWIVRGRAWLISAALLAVGLALYAGWDWLAALGVTSVLIAFAPCLAMCALGLCMRHNKPTADEVRVAANKDATPAEAER